MNPDDRRPADNPDPWTPADTGIAAARPRRRALFVAAMAVFALGVAFTLIAALAPFVLGRDAPTLLYLAAIIFTPLGFLLGLLYAILGSRPPRV